MLQHLQPSKRLNFRLLTILLFLSGSLAAQQNFLEVPVKLEIEKGNMDEVVIKVKKDGKDAFTQNGSSKLRFKLDFNKQYTLIFTKPGYITKTIQINTKAPAARISNGFDPYKIGVKLFLQNAENMVIYNQPVANIKYDQNLDEFNFDTDYSKSILSAISRDTEEDQAATTRNSTATAETQSGTETNAAAPETTAGAETVRGTETETGKGTEVKTESPLTAGTGNEPTPEAITTPPGAGDQEQKATATASEGDSPKPSATASSGEEQARTAGGSGDSDEKRRGRDNSGDDGLNKKLTVKSGEDVYTTTGKTSNGSEAPPGYTPAGESEKITREDIVERNRVVTKIKVIKNGIQTEYSRVYYNWGGLYYFKNNTMSISENLFVNWTGVRN